jgi:hypothetical protein
MALLGVNKFFDAFATMTLEDVGASHEYNNS